MGRELIFERWDCMEKFIILAILLVFCLVLTYNLGYKMGYKKGATIVLDNWRDWLNKIEEEENVGSER